MNFLPDSLDLRITSVCNLECPFCYGTRIISEISKSDWLNLIVKFRAHGTQTLVITGGEPTLYTHLLDIVLFARKLGFNIILSTNGSWVYTERMQLLLDNIDWLALPVDGQDYIHCHHMRSLSFDHYENIYELLRIVKINHPNVKIRVGTILTQINSDIENLRGIYNQINGKVDLWKLYQMSPHTHNKAFFTKNEINDRMFASIFQHLQQSLLSDSATGMIINFYSSNERNGRYLFCEPDASAIIIRNGEEHCIGNFITNFELVLMNWSEFVNDPKISMNVESGYLKRK